MGFIRCNALAGISQIPLPSDAFSSKLPQDVQRCSNNKMVVVKSHLDGRQLFEIASPVVFDRNNPANKLPVEIRAQQITASLDRVWPLGQFQNSEDLKVRSRSQPANILLIKAYKQILTALMFIDTK